MNKVKDIGTLSGRILLFGGVYSNLEALHAIQGVAKEQHIAAENVICTGDVVGYCADPDTCLQTIKDWGVHTIAGNVELNLKDELDSCGCNFNEGSRCDNFSKQWYPYAQSKVSPDSMRFIEQIPEFISFTHAGKKVFVLHGSVENTSAFIFQSTNDEVKKAIFAETEADIIIAGHAGLPFAQYFEGKLWLNPGVIGMPANDGTPRVWYALLEDSAEVAFSILPLDYSHLRASEKIRAQPLPASYAETLETGIWDNLEILPPTEQSLQGTAIKENVFNI